ncbi:hypothetical protein C5F59_027575 [Streptomyces sp. QL37]|uniref:hypothetical protein n=1 Tax=Streptomyces sp. QL37 TaxID=2093747 RepID=UPI000CF28327|nr:hypothetical protein [Streptomyces sp. QL37]PPQ57126.1 hypothetical protein C5F59_10865 [Streptomyces sp. QL37]
MTVTDRIRAFALPADHTTTDQLLHRILALPSLAAQLLTAAADHLAKHKPADELTVAGWGRALALADARTLTGYPQHIAQNAGRRAMGALAPAMWEQARTRGEWALLLRDAARTV